MTELALQAWFETGGHKVSSTKIPKEEKIGEKHKKTKQENGNQDSVTKCLKWIPIEDLNPKIVYQMLTKNEKNKVMCA